MGVIVQFCLTVVDYTILNIWVLIVVVPFFLLKIYVNKSVGKLKVNSRLDGKTVIVTGANTGCGYETAKELSNRGARVIMACRNLGSAHVAKARIIKETRNDDIEVKRIDLSSIWSVKQFAKEIVEQEKRLDIIIFNAAIGIIGNKKTNDDLQLTWQINQFSSFILVNLLLDLMKATGPGKIIFVNSAMHHFGCLNKDDPILENSNCPWKIHCNTKFANLLTANYLSTKLKDSGISVNTANPGLLNTNVLRRAKHPIIEYIITFFTENYGKDPMDAAATSLTLALDTNLKNVTGKYFSDCRQTRCKSSRADNMNLAEKLWKRCEEILDLQEDEMHFK